MAMAATAAASACQQRARPCMYEVELQAIEDYRRFAALAIQRYYRGWIVRLHRARQEAAVKDQQQATAAHQAKARHLYKAAHTIQDCWRSYKNRRIYRFYRDLIHFREAADPRQLLRCINAPEANLVDPAAGLHIRFRLGGSSFPPMLLYKVFTHRPVTDICAFGPRNYAAEGCSGKPTAAASAVTHKPLAHAAAVQSLDNTHASSSSSNSTTPSRVGWYCRDDKNSWRPVVELQQQLDLPQGGWAHSNCSSQHHRPIPLHRRHGRTRLNTTCSSGGGGGGGGGGGSSSNQSINNDAPGAGSRQGDDEVVEASGYSSEPEMLAGRAANSPHGVHRGKQRQQQYYHHSPLVRRADKVQQLKLRKRQWLLKMYRAGMQAGTGSRPSDTPTATAASESATTSAAGAHETLSRQPAVNKQQRQSSSVQQGVTVSCQTCSSEEQLLQQLEHQLLLSQAGNHASNSHGSCNSGLDAAEHKPAPSSSAGLAGEGWDIDELLLLGLDAGILAWAQRLDFDSYQEQWASTAVSLPSEAAVPQSERALLQQLA